MRNLSCPATGKQIDEHVVRGVAAHVALLTLLAIWLSNYWIAVFLVFDFLARAVGLPKLSLLRRSSAEILELLNISPKPTDAGAKQFAARIGTVVTLLFLFSLLSQSLLPELLIGGMLLVFATLEAIFGICIGCYAYRWLPNG